MPSSHFEHGNQAFNSEQWDEAIRRFRAAIEEDHRHADSYIALVRAYEAAAEESGDTQMLVSAVRVCREGRKLHLDERQRAILDESLDRIAESLRDLTGEED